MGITEAREINQIAKYSLVEWDDNISISDAPPAEYWPLYTQRSEGDELQQMMRWHALPEHWQNMDYREFLIERRRLIAKMIREGFGKLRESHMTQANTGTAEVVTARSPSA
jgi:hypothetical protein